MSAQLDRGWICDVQFVRSGTDDVLQSGSSSLPLLLTASNSAVVALWDISKTSDEGMPHKLLENTCTHSGAASCPTKPTYPLQDNDQNYLCSDSQSLMAVSITSPCQPVQTVTVEAEESCLSLHMRLWNVLNLRALHGLIPWWKRAD